MSENISQQEQIGDTSRRPGNSLNRGLMCGFLELLTDGLEQIEDKVRNRKHEAEAGSGSDEQKTG